MEPQRPSFDLMAAGSVLIGSTGACIVLGLLIGWLAGNAGIGFLLGAVVGIPVGIAMVYRRYGRSLA